MTKNTTSILLLCLLSVSLLVTLVNNDSNDSPRPGYLTLGDDKIYYDVAGGGFPLILVSGGSGMDLRQWDRISPSLAKTYQVIRYDPRGVGMSDNPTARYSDAADLIELLDHLGLDRVALIGL
jgi:pimeloyl-ACP methyl ester carboxylesterase